MSLTLHVDGARWRAHLDDVARANPGLTPVVKGNGYGLTLPRLARRAGWLREQGHDVDTVAVGTYSELDTVALRFDGDLLVLTPWRPFGPALELDERLRRRVLHTVGRLEDLTALLDRHPDARVVLERRTSMLRHGFDADGLRAAGRLLRERRTARVAGVALHLPLDQGSHLAEVLRLMDDVVAADLPTRTLWVSHLSADELAALRRAYADYAVRPRVGTALWLGDRGALRVGSTVLDVHPLRRGQAYGYRGRTAPWSGHLLVVGGGTAHGIGLAAPAGESGVRARAAVLARGGLAAVGLVRSPFTVDGRQRLFAEPPHMQASMLLLPSGARAPEVGDELDVRVRYTTTSFDRVLVD